MQKCKYATFQGTKYKACNECNYAWFNKCPKYIAAYNADMTRDLWPFTVDKTVSVDSPAVWSRNMDIAKTAAYRMSEKTKHRVVKLALRNALDYMMSGIDLDLDNKVVYIEILTRPIQEPKSVGMLLVSFIEKMQIHNTQVSIYCAPLSLVTLESTVTKL